MDDLIDIAIDVLAAIVASGYVLCFLLGGSVGALITWLVMR